MGPFRKFVIHEIFSILILPLAFHLVLSSLHLKYTDGEEHVDFNEKSTNERVRSERTDCVIIKRCFGSTCGCTESRQEAESVWPAPPEVRRQDYRSAGRRITSSSH